MSTKLVILAAGRGQRMRREVVGARLTAEQREAARQGLKGLIPIAGRPFLDHVIGAATRAGVSDVCLVVAPGDNPIRSHYERRPPRHARLAFAVQRGPLGSAHALLAAEAFAGGDPVIVINSDNLYPTAAFAALRRIEGSALAAFRPAILVFRGNVPADRITAYALVRAGEDGYLTSIVEKPDATELERAGDDALISMTCWRFDPVIFEACRQVALSSRGEYELPDAAMLAMREFGERFRVVPVDEPVLDLSTQADIATVEAALGGEGSPACPPAP